MTIPSLQVKCLLPDEMSFDFAVNTMVYQPGAALSMVEMHVMEHGLIMLEGGGIYRLGDHVVFRSRAGDVIWMATVVPAVVRSDRQGARKISRLQRFSSASPRGPVAAMTLARSTGDRLLSEIEALASISDAEAPAVTRIVFTPTDLKARAWLKARIARRLASPCGRTPIGNTFARWEWFGPDGAGGRHRLAHRRDSERGQVRRRRWECWEAWRRSARCRDNGFRPKHSIELLVFTAEEPTRFGIGCIGSRLLSGTLSADAARKLADNDGESHSTRFAAACRIRRRTRTSEAAAATTTRPSSNCTLSKARGWNASASRSA
jgi:hypothetical protein